MLNRLMPLLVLVLLLLQQACANTPPPSASTSPSPKQITPFLSIPFTLTGEGLYQIEVSLNGQGPYQFLIDTGATISVVFEHTANTLNLDTTAGETATIHGIIDSQERPLGVLAQLTVGSLQKSNLRVAILEDRVENPSLDGILGLDFLKEHALVFDLDRMSLDFTVSDQFQAPRYRRWNFIRLNPNPYAEEDYGLVFLYLTLGGYRTPALLDLGASFSVANWSTGQNRQLRTYRLRLRERWELEGAIGTFSPKLTARFNKIFAGEHTWYNQNVLMLDLQTLNIIGVDGKPLMIAGADLFNDSTIAIDFPGQRLYVKPNATYLKRQREESITTGSRLSGGGTATISIAPTIERKTDDEKNTPQDKNQNRN